MELTKLYRPTGIREYTLIKENEYSCFPPRLEWQPIFYPVMNQAYAEQIARNWNTKDEFSGFCGLVTSFKVDANYLQKFQVKIVGGKIHNELWVPSEDLEEFNEHIYEKIEIVNGFFGDRFMLEENKIVQPYYLKFK